MRRGKRHSRISSRRWETYEIGARKFRSSLEGYSFIEVERKTILEIYRFWRVFLERQGIEDPKLIGDIIYERNLDS
jgi:hypothetical protein